MSPSRRSQIAPCTSAPTLSRPSYVEFLDDDAITFPANALPFCLIEACGGGGGGGGGYGNAGAGYYASGGGGGGGAILSTRLLVIEPGELYAVAIGSQGPGGDGGINTTAPTDGGEGGDTTLTKNSPSTLVATWRGARGGQQGLVNGSGGLCVKSIGGGPERTTITFSSFSFDPTVIEILSEINESCVPQSGGNGLCSRIPSTVRGRKGMGSPQGFAGGAHGVSDTTNSGSYQGGGQGGGGGGGPYGAGGAGGNGGDPNNSGNSGGGLTGLSGAANSGAGGGGGGAGGGATGNSYGGSGHHGGTGRMRIVYFVPVV